MNDADSREQRHVSGEDGAGRLQAMEGVLRELGRCGGRGGVDGRFVNRVMSSIEGSSVAGRAGVSPWMWARRVIVPVSVAAGLLVAAWFLRPVQPDSLSSPASVSSRIHLREVKGNVTVSRMGEDAWGMVRRRVADSGEDAWGVLAGPAAMACGEDAWGSLAPGQTAVDGMGLLAGHVVTTGPESGAVLADTVTGKRVTIEAGSRLALAHDSDLFFVVAGSISVTGQSGEGQWLGFLTDHARFTVIGTTFQMLVRSGWTRLEVRDGLVGVTEMSRREMLRVEAGQQAVVGHGIPTGFSSIGMSPPVDWRWEFGSPADARVFRLYRGRWQHNPLTRSMDVGAGDQAEILLDMPPAAYPLVIEYATAAIGPKAGVKVSYGSNIWFDRAEEAAEFDYMNPTRQQNLNPGQTGDWEINRVYVTEQHSIDFKHGKMSSVTFYSRAEDSSLVLAARGAQRIRSFSIRSVSADEIPDVSALEGMLKAVPPERRSGSAMITDPSNPSRRMGVRFNRPHKLSPYDY